jgi:hypothetical protein
MSERSGTAPSTLASSTSDGANASAPRFDWPLATEAEQLLRQWLESFLSRHSSARRLGDRMLNETGTDLFEWLDHLAVSSEQEEALLEAGFALDTRVESSRRERVYEHPRATLPRVRIIDGHGPSPSLIALRPESLADFIAAQNLESEPEREPFSRYRTVLVAEENGLRLEAVERHGYRGFVPAPLQEGQLAAIVKARELWQTRRRQFANSAEGFAAAEQTLERALGLVGRDLACQFFFEAERAYWERRNRAGQIQRRRQDKLGLGWGNHDHHTFRCSREHFVDLNEFLLKLGFEKRERYYAGAEAGWGAQISEQATVGIVVFADVDLMPEETQIDFSTQKLPPAPRLGTVGLWVGLHGESFLEAGMHHLEARFEFDALREQLATQGVSTMKPFSDFEFLCQAFTEGERWPVRREQLERLLSAALITREQYDQFLETGALGSHLENLQRHGGFKGFNQKSVSVVIAATDPRKQHFRATAA